MNKTILGVAAIATLTGAVAIPSIATGNARRTDGSLEATQAAQQPYTAELSGDNEVPGPGDADASGAATVSFAPLDDVTTEVCWDMSYDIPSGDPTAAHIHAGAAGDAGDVVFNFGAPSADSFSGCLDAVTADIQPIIDSPADFYVNVHNAAFTGGAIRGQLAAGPEAAGATFLLPTPLRAFDSRVAPATKLGSEETQTISLSTGTNADDEIVIAVPPGATGAIITLTANDTDGPGFLSVYSADSDKPATSSLNFLTAGTAIAVSTQVAVDDSGSVKVTSGGAGTHFIIDVTGYLY